MTSDEFFGRGTPKSRYDITLIDGLHTSRHTWTDFTHSLVFVDPQRHPAWIIDDVIPDSEFETIPSNRESKRAFKRAGQRPGLWRGDVWKVLYALDACRGIEFAVFGTQALVWQAADGRDVRLPRARQLGAIETLNFNGDLLRERIAPRKNDWNTALSLSLTSKGCSCVGDA